MHTATRAAPGGGGFGGGDPRCGGLRASGGGDDGAATTNLDIPCEGGEDDATVPTMPTVSTLKRENSKPLWTQAWWFTASRTEIRAAVRTKTAYRRSRSKRRTRARPRGGGGGGGGGDNGGGAPADTDPPLHLSSWATWIQNMLIVKSGTRGEPRGVRAGVGRFRPKRSVDNVTYAIHARRAPAGALQLAFRARAPPPPKCA
jgi:hypothetical protein